MTYYINPIWFYLMNLSTDIKGFLCIGGAIAVIVASIIFITCVVDDDWDITDMTEEEIAVSKKFKKIICAGFIAIFIGVFVPSKETCIEMMVASQITHENVTATKEEIYELIDHIIDKVNNEEIEE